MKRESNMAAGLFTTKKMALLIVLALMTISVVYLIVGQQNSQVSHYQILPLVREDVSNEVKGLKEADNPDSDVARVISEKEEKPKVNLKERPVEIPLRRPVVKRKDTVDNSGALSYLKQYAELFDNKFIGISGVNPNKPKTIENWWQAAAMIDWYINSPIRYKCENRMAVGNWHICQDSPYTIKPPCLVYSFGINFDFSFDDAMSKLGCEVHSFDPSMNKDTHKRGENSTFHNLGLSNTNTDGFLPRKDSYVNNPQIWKMRTLKSVMKELGHEEKVIDVLKIDIEGHEWAVMDNMMETDVFKYVRQFMLEFHLFPDWPLKEDYVYLYQLYTRLREIGFREYAVGPHPKTLKIKQFNNQGDSEYVNIFFNQSGDVRS